MNLKVSVGISNHHVHLTEEVYHLLFKEEIKNVKNLKQKNEFASNVFVTLKGPKGSISHVRVLGPFRNYNQVEISSSDAYILGVCPPVRKSGDLKDAEEITLIGSIGTITLKNACILAQAHIHMSFKDLETYGLQNDEVKDVIIDKERKGIIKAHIKASENGVLEFHIDRDEANAFLLQNGMELNVKL